MGHRKFNDIVGDINAERRSRIDAIKDEARADAVAFNLAELRRHRQLTQVELAERLNEPQSFVSKYESGERRLDVLELREVCAALGISLTDFVGRLEHES